MAKSVNPGWHHKPGKQRQTVSQRVISRALQHKSPTQNTAAVNSFHFCPSRKGSGQATKPLFI